MGRPGPLFKIAFHKHRGLQWPSAVESTSRARGGGGGAVPSHISSGQADAECGSNEASGHAAHVLPSVAFSHCDVVKGCSVCMSEKQVVLAEAEDYADMCSVAVPAGLFGSPALRGESSDDLLFGNYVVGFPEPGVCSSLVVPCDHNILTEPACAENIFSDGPAELAWQLRCGLDRCYEYPEFGEGSAPESKRQCSQDCEVSTTGHGSVSRDTPREDSHRRTLPKINVGIPGKASRSSKGGSKAVAPVAAPFRCPRSFIGSGRFKDGLQMVRGSVVAANKSLYQPTLPRVDSRPDSAVTVGGVHRADEARATRSGEQGGMVPPDQRTTAKETLCSLTRPRRMAFETIRRLRAIFDGCSGGSGSVILIALSMASLVFLILLISWLLTLS